MQREVERAGQEYCDEGEVQELDSLTLDALGAVERAWKALCVVTDAHEAQLREAEEAELSDDEDDDTPAHSAPG